MRSSNSLIIASKPSCFRKGINYTIVCYIKYPYTGKPKERLPSVRLV